MAGVASALELSAASRDESGSITRVTFSTSLSSALIGMLSTSWSESCESGVFAAESFDQLLLGSAMVIMVRTKALRLRALRIGHFLMCRKSYYSFLSLYEKNILYGTKTEKVNKIIVLKTLLQHLFYFFPIIGRNSLNWPVEMHLYSMHFFPAPFIVNKIDADAGTSKSTGSANTM